MSERYELVSREKGAIVETDKRIRRLRARSPSTSIATTIDWRITE